jgi:molybdopterin molybdotransferase
MGKAVRRTLGGGEAMRISTGGMLPPGADAVVMVEYTEEVGRGSLEIHRAVAPWEHVVRIGDDIRAGDPIFRAGRRLRAHDLGALTGVGVTRVPVFRRPVVALAATGDEIVPPDDTPRPGQVRNVNQYSLRAMIAEAGGVAKDLGVIADRAEQLRPALVRALRAADVIMLSGGSSVGAKDMTLDIIGSLPGAETIFHGISIAPGKPTILARVRGERARGRGGRAGVPILGLPGHPVSALVIFHRFGAPLVRIVGGESAAAAFAPARVASAVLATNVDSQPGREDYVRVTLARRESADGSGASLLAHPIPAKSAAIFSLVRADGMIRVPLEAEGLEAGTEVEVILF